MEPPKAFSWLLRLDRLLVEEEILLVPFDHEINMLLV